MIEILQADILQAVTALLATCTTAWACEEIMVWDSNTIFIIKNIKLKAQSKYKQKLSAVPKI